jgi:hypothetical protein
MPIGRDLVRLRRGLRASIPVLEDGEPGWTKDEKALYIGTPEGNERIPNKADLEYDVEYEDYGTADSVNIQDQPALKTDVDALTTVVTQHSSQLADIVTINARKYSTIVAPTNYKYTVDVDSLQTEIDSYDEGNCQVDFPNGYYIISKPIKLRNKTLLTGKGSSKSMLYAPDGNNIIEIDLTPTGSDPVFSGASIKNIGIQGSNSSLTQRGISIFNTRYDDTSLYPSELRNGIFENLTISDCGFGIYIGLKVALVKLNNIMAHTCHNIGINASCTDSMFSNIKATYCKNGFNCEGSNNQFVNAKLYMNGICRHGEDYTTTYGGRFIGSRCVYTNIDAQENRYHGLVFEIGHNIILNGIVADANGYQKAITPEIDYAGTGVVLYNVTNVIGKITADNYHTTQYQKSGLSINSGSSNILIEYTENNQVNAWSGTTATNTTVIMPTDQFSNITVLNNLKTGWTAYNPTITWSTANPTGVSIKAKYKKIEKTISMQVQITATNGNGATNVLIPLPIAPKTQNVNLRFPSMVLVGTNWTARPAQVRDDGTNNDVMYYYMGTATVGQYLELNMEFTYEIA